MGRASTNGLALRDSVCSRKADRGVPKEVGALQGRELVQLSIKGHACMHACAV